MADSETSSEISSSDEVLYRGPITRGRAARRRTGPRTRGGSRGRGEHVQLGRVGKRSKGKGRALTSTDVERIRGFHTERVKKAEELVAEMEGEEAKDMLLEVVKKQPSLILEVSDFLKKRQRQRRNSESPPSPSPPTSDTPAWCVCGRCRQMATDAEKICCGMDTAHCMSVRPEMELAIMDPLVLHLQQMYRRDLFALHAVEETDLNKGYRHAAYRQYILWQFGRLTEGDRRVVPSCCVWRIRVRFPDANNAYVGFVPGRLY